MEIINEKNGKRPDAIGLEYDEKGSYFSKNGSSSGANIETKIGKLQSSFGTLFFTDIDPKYFERIGFNCAMGEDVEGAFKKVVDGVEQWLEEQFTSIDREYGRRQKLVEENIEAAKAKETYLKDRKRVHLEGITSLKLKLNNLEREIKSLKKELSEKLIEFASKKENFFNKAIDKVKGELSEITKLYHEQAEERYGVENTMVQKMKGANEYNLEDLHKRHSLFSKQWEDITKSLSLHGFSMRPGLATFGLFFTLFVSLLVVSLLLMHSEHILPFFSKVGLGLVGFFLSFVMPIFSYYYIRNIVEPRMNMANGGNKYAKHWEFFMFGLVFFVSAGVLAWSIYMPKNTPVVVSFSSWLLLILSAGYVLALFLRIVLLYRYKRKVETSLHDLNKQIIAFTYPGANDLGGVVWNKFKEEFQCKLDSLYELLNKKVKYAQDIYTFSDTAPYHFWWERVVLVRHVVKVGRFIIRRLRRYVYPISDGEELYYVYEPELLAKQDFRILKWEKIWFPVEVEELRQLRKHISALELQLDKLSVEYKRQETESTEYCFKLDADILQVRNSIRGYEGELTKQNDAYARDRSLANQFKIKVLYCLEKGFNLGKWYFDRPFSKRLEERLNNGVKKQVDKN